MSYTHPAFLVLLAPIAALVAGYLVLQRRRRHYAVRFTNLDLLQSVAPRRPGWRRHVPAAAAALALAAATVGLAQPRHETKIPRESAVVMLALDVSASMAATDVSPDRLTSAVQAAAAFVAELPAGFQVGLVAFDSSARTMVQATNDHSAVIAALQRLTLGRGTAAGDGILSALQAVAAAQAAAGASADAWRGAGIAAPPGLRTTASIPVPPIPVPATPVPATPAPATATIVLLSDGATTSGTPVLDAALVAAEAGVPVSTITFGSESGTVSVNGRTAQVPPDPQAMSEVAEITGGSAFDAATDSELRSVYGEIQARVGHVTEYSPLMVWFLGAALLLMTAAVLGSLVWTARFL